MQDHDLVISIGESRYKEILVTVEDAQVLLVTRKSCNRHRVRGSLYVRRLDRQGRTNRLGRLL